jgi:hypothetical protein
MLDKRGNRTSGNYINFVSRCWRGDSGAAIRGELAEEALHGVLLVGIVSEVKGFAAG